MMTSSCAFQASTRIRTGKRTGPFLSHPPSEVVSEKCVFRHLMQTYAVSTTPCGRGLRHRHNAGGLPQLGTFCSFRERLKMCWNTPASCPARALMGCSRCLGYLGSGEIYQLSCGISRGHAPFWSRPLGIRALG